MFNEKEAEERQKAAKSRWYEMLSGSHAEWFNVAVSIGLSKYDAKFLADKNYGDICSEEICRKEAILEGILPSK
jgi:hypothetical protein